MVTRKYWTAVILTFFVKEPGIRGGSQASGPELRVIINEKAIAFILVINL